MSLLAVPFFDFSSKVKITYSTAAVIFGEVTFWIGGILLGKELFNKYKYYFNPLNWFKKKTPENSGTDNITID